MLLGSKHYPKDQSHVFEYPNSIPIRLFGLPFLLLGLYVLFLWLSPIFGIDQLNVDSELVNAVIESEQETSPDRIDGVWAHLLLAIIVFLTLGFGLPTVLGLNRITINLLSREIRSELILVKPILSKTRKILPNPKISVFYSTAGRGTGPGKEAGWKVLLTGSGKSLARFVNEKPARNYAFEVAEALELGLNDIDNDQLRLALPERLARNANKLKSPKLRKGGVVETEDQLDSIILKHPPKLSAKLVFSIFSIFLAVVWLYLWPTEPLGQDKMLIIFSLLLMLSIFLFVLLIKLVNEEIFGFSIQLNPESIYIYQNYILFARSSEFAINEIWELIKDPTTIAIFSKKAIKRFGRSLSASDKTYIYKYILYWIGKSDNGY